VVVGWETGAGAAGELPLASGIRRRDAAAGGRC